MQIMTESKPENRLKKVGTMKQKSSSIEIMERGECRGYKEQLMTESRASSVTHGGGSMMAWARMAANETGDSDIYL